MSATQEYMQYFFTVLLIKRLSEEAMVSQIFWWCKWWSSLTSWRLWQFIPLESDFSGASTLWRLQNILKVSAEYVPWYCQHEKKGVFYARKNKHKFFHDSFTPSTPSCSQRGECRISVSCFYYGAVHGREIHQGLLKTRHYLWLRKPLRCKFVVARSVFWGHITMCFLYSHTFL